MAVYGVLGDIHGNREALMAVLDLLERERVEQLLCVGDIVGYNADPDSCAELVRNRGARAIAGNHELISLGRLDFSRCSNQAMYSLKRTRRRLGAATAAYLAALPDRLALDDGVVLVHGGVRDVQQYMVSIEHIRQNLAYLRADFPAGRICLYGHMHEQRVYEVDGAGEVRQLPATGCVPLGSDRLYFINPGSVDPSRKGSHKFAECAVLDTGRGNVTFHRLAYDHGATERKAAAGGYRIGRWTDRLYTLRRRVARRLGR